MLEIYTDNKSNKKKYLRVLMFLGIISLPLWVGLTRDIPYNGLGDFYQFFRVFMFVLLMVYLYAIVRLLLRIRQLSSG